MSQSGKWMQRQMPPDTNVGFSQSGNPYQQKSIYISDDVEEVMEPNTNHNKGMDVKKHKVNSVNSQATYQEEDLGDYDRLMQQAEMGAEDLVEETQNHESYQYQTMDDQSEAPNDYSPLEQSTPSYYSNHSNTESAIPDFAAKYYQQAVEPQDNDEYYQQAVEPQGNDEIITLSSDEEDRMEVFKQPVRPSMPFQPKRRKVFHNPVLDSNFSNQPQYGDIHVTRKGQVFFHPKYCGICNKPKRDVICLARHLIHHHWESMRQYKAPGSKGSTDYFNLPDDREIKPPKETGDEPRMGSYEEAFKNRSKYITENMERQLLESDKFASSNEKSGMWKNPRFNESIAGNVMNRENNGNNPNSFHRDIEINTEQEIIGTERQSLIEEANIDPTVIQKKLGLLLHAHKCQHRNTKRKQNSMFGPDIQDCKVKGCESTKITLHHITACQEGDSCSVIGCPSAKQVIQWALSGDMPRVSNTLRSELHRLAKVGLPKDVVQYMTSEKGKDKWGSWRKTKLGAPGSSQPLPPTTNLTPPINRNKHPQMNPELASWTASQKGPSSSMRLPPSGPGLNQFGTLNSTPNNRPNLSQTNNDQIANNNIHMNNTINVEDKYKEAIARRKATQGEAAGVAAASIARLGQIRAVKEKPEESGSKAPIDFLGSLLNNQNITLEHRTVKKPEPIVDRRYGNITKQGSSNNVQKSGNILPKSKQVKPLKISTNLGNDAAAYNSMLDL